MISETREDIEDNYIYYSVLSSDSVQSFPGKKEDIKHQNQIYDILSNSKQKFESFILPIQTWSKNKYYVLKKQCHSWRSLSCILNENQSVPKIRCYKIFLNLCEAVRFIHLMGIVHRNLNLQTVLVHQSKPHCKLYQFKYAANLLSNCIEFTRQEDDQHYNLWSNKEKAYLKDIYNLTQIYDMLFHNNSDKLTIIDEIRNKCLNPEIFNSFQQIEKTLKNLCDQIKQKIKLLESNSSKKSDSLNHIYSPTNSENFYPKETQLQQSQIDDQRKLFENNIKKLELISDLIISNYSLFKQLNSLRLYQIMKLSYQNIIEELKKFNIIKSQRQYENKIKYLERKLMKRKKIYQGSDKNTCFSLLMCSMSDEKQGLCHQKNILQNFLQKFLQKDLDNNNLLLTLFTLIVQEFKCLIEQILDKDLMNYGIWVILQVMMCFQKLFNIQKYTKDDQLKYLYHIKLQYDKYKFSWFEAEDKNIKDMCAQIKKKTYKISDMVKRKKEEGHLVQP